MFALFKKIRIIGILLLDSWCHAIMSTVISNYILPTKEESQARNIALIVTYIIMDV